MSQQFLITAPDGTKYQVTGPDGATEQDALAQVQAQHSTAPQGPSVLKQALMAPVGAAEMVAQGTTGAVASIPAALAYGGAAVAKAAGADVDPSAVQNRVQNYLTYQPKSDSAKAGDAALTSMIAPVVAPVAKGYAQATDAVAAKSPIAGELMRSAPGAFQAASALVPGAVGVRTAMANAARPAATNSVADIATRALTNAPTAKSVVANATKAGGALAPAKTAEEVLARQAAASPTNMGAAAAAPSLQVVSPQLKAAIVNFARKNGGAVPPEVLARHIDADTLPVKVPITEGHATQDVHLLSEEFNMKGAIPELGTRFDDINKALAANVQAIRDEVGPDVFSANHVEHGDTLIRGYRAEDTAAQEAISADYKALKDAAGGSFPVDAQALLQNASADLHSELLFDHAPSAVMKTLQRLATTNKMTFENFESMRTNLARIQRSATADGNEKRAAAIIRNAMESLPLKGGAEALKPLADKARATAKAHYDRVEADPAFAAAVSGDVPPDRFVQKFVIGGTRDDVALMRQNLANNEPAIQTMGVAALDHLRDAAALNPHYQGNFASKSFNQALIKLSPKLQSLLPSKAVEQAEQLGRVAGYTTFQPKGSYFNNPNTFIAQAADKAKSVAQIGANLAVPGLGAGDFLRKRFEGRQASERAARAMAPGAGLGRLRDIGKTSSTP